MSDDAAIASGDCRLTLALPSGPNPYLSLEHAAQGELHFTCPFDSSKAPSVRVFFSGKSSACRSGSVAGLKVIQTASVPGGKAGFEECSDLLSGFDHKTMTAADLVSYVWLPHDATALLSDAQQREDNHIHEAIAFSGLPIVDDRVSNVGICFSERSGTIGPPSVWLSKLNIRRPGWVAVERQLPGKSCADAFDPAAAN